MRASAAIFGVIFFLSTEVLGHQLANTTLSGWGLGRALAPGVADWWKRTRSPAMELPGVARSLSQSVSNDSGNASVPSALALEQQAPESLVPLNQTDALNIAFVDPEHGSSSPDCFPCKTLTAGALTVAQRSYGLSGASVFVLARENSVNISTIGSLSVSQGSRWDVQCAKAWYWWHSIARKVQASGCNASLDHGQMLHPNVSCPSTGSTLSGREEALNQYILLMRERYANGSESWGAESCPLVESRQTPSAAWLIVRNGASLALSGSFVYNASSAPAGSLTQSNAAGHVFGPLFVFGGTMHIRPSLDRRTSPTFDSPRSTTVGGVAFVFGPTSGLRASSIRVLRARAAVAGGALYAGGGAAVVVDGLSTFESCTAEAEPVGVFNVHLFLGYLAVSGGGALSADQASGIVIDGQVRVVEGSAERGGGLSCVGGSSCYLSNGFVVFGGQAGLYGGAVYAESQSLLKIASGATFSNSISQGGGCIALLEGALLETSGQVKLFNCTASSIGGGVLVQTTALLRSSFGTSIRQCSAPFGGGIFAEDVGGIEFHGEIQDCSASLEGAAIRFENQRCSWQAACFPTGLRLGRRSRVSECSGSACLVIVGRQAPTESVGFIGFDGQGKHFALLEGVVANSSRTGVVVFGEHAIAVLSGSIHNCSDDFSVGGVWVQSGASLVSTGSISSCAGGTAGGVLVDLSVETKASFAVFGNGSVITDCSSRGVGGGIRVGGLNQAESVVPPVNSSRVWPRPLVVMEGGSVITRCQAGDGAQQGAGGGVHVQIGRFVMRPGAVVSESNVITNHLAPDGFGNCIYVGNGGTAHLRGTIRDCGSSNWSSVGTPQVFGGGLAVVRQDLSVYSTRVGPGYARISYGARFIRNSASSGGALFIYDFAPHFPDPPVLEVISTDSELPAWFGVSNTSASRLFLDSSDKDSLRSASCGSHPELWICQHHSNFSLDADGTASTSPSSIIFTRNRATAAYGGAICASKQFLVRIMANDSDILFEHNEAAIAGGGGYLELSQLSYFAGDRTSFSVFNGSRITGEYHENGQERAVLFWARDPRFDPGDSVTTVDAAWADTNTVYELGSLRSTPWQGCDPLCGARMPRALDGGALGRVIFNGNRAASGAALVLADCDHLVVVGVEFRNSISTRVSPHLSESWLRANETSSINRAGAVALTTRHMNFSPFSRVLWGCVFASSSNTRGQVGHLLLAGPAEFWQQGTPQLGEAEWSLGFVGSLFGHSSGTVFANREDRLLPTPLTFAVYLHGLQGMRLASFSLVGDDKTTERKRTFALGLALSDVRVERALIRKWGSGGLGGGVEALASTVSFGFSVFADIEPSSGAVVAGVSKIALDRGCVIYRIREPVSVTGGIKVIAPESWLSRPSMALGLLPGMVDPWLYWGEGTIVANVSGTVAQAMSYSGKVADNPVSGVVVSRAPWIFSSIQTETGAAAVSVSANLGTEATWSVMPPFISRASFWPPSSQPQESCVWLFECIEPPLLDLLLQHDLIPSAERLSPAMIGASERLASDPSGAFQMQPRFPGDESSAVISDSIGFGTGSTIGLREGAAMRLFEGASLVLRQTTSTFASIGPPVSVQDSSIVIEGRLDITNIFRAGVAGCIAMDGGRAVIAGYFECSQVTLSGSSVAMLVASSTLALQGSMVLQGVRDFSDTARGSGGILVVLSSVQVQETGRLLLGNITMKSGAALRLMQESAVAVDGRMLIANVTSVDTERTQYAACVSVWRDSLLAIDGIVRLSQCQADSSAALFVHERSSVRIGKPDGLLGSVMGSNVGVPSNLEVARAWAMIQRLPSSSWPLEDKNVSSAVAQFRALANTVEAPYLIVDQARLNPEDSGAEKEIALRGFKSLSPVFVLDDQCEVGTTELHGMLCLHNQGGCSLIRCLRTTPESRVRLSKVAMVGNHHGIADREWSRQIGGALGLWGGALQVSGWQEALLSGVVAWDNCVSHFGGGVTIASCANCTMMDFDVQRNSAGASDECRHYPLSFEMEPVSHAVDSEVTGYGGGISVILDSKVLLARGLISHNTAKGSGGGLYVGLGGSAVTLHDVDTSRNMAHGIGGGGLATFPFFPDDGQPSVEFTGNSSLSFNGARGIGGALLASRTVSVEICMGLGGSCSMEMLGNTADVAGGAAFFSTNVTIHNARVASNSARRVGAILIENPSQAPVGASFARTLVVDNWAKCREGGLSCGLESEETVPFSVQLEQGVLFENNSARLAPGNQCGSSCLFDGCPQLDTRFDKFVFVGGDSGDVHCCGHPSLPCSNVSVALEKISGATDQTKDHDEVVLLPGEHHGSVLVTSKRLLVIRGANEEESLVAGRERDESVAIFHVGEDEMVTIDRQGRLLLSRLLIRGHGAVCVGLVGTGSVLEIERATVEGCREALVLQNSSSGITTLRESLLKGGGRRALLALAGKLALDGVEVHEFGDESEDGGLIFADGQSALEIRSSRLRGGVGRRGGLIFLGGSSSARLLDSVLLNGRSFSHGGCIAVDGERVSVEINNSTVSQCSSQDGSGGGVHVDRGTLSASSVTLLECSAPSGRGGGMSALGGSRVTLRDVGFVRCHAGRSGGGLSVTASHVEIVDGTLRECTARSTGGGLSFVAVPQALVVGVVTLDCQSASGGGADFANSKVVMINSSFLHCYANSGYGGGLQVREGEISIDGLLTEDTRTNMDGGAAYFQDVSQGSISNVFAKNSTSGRHGGCVAMASVVPSTINFVEWILSDCTAATGSGGALALVSSVPAVTMHWDGANVTIINSTAPEGSGGGVLMDGTSIGSLIQGLRIQNTMSPMGGCVAVRKGARLHAQAAHITECRAQWLGKAVLVHDAALSMLNATLASHQSVGSLSQGPIVALLDSSGAPGALGSGFGTTILDGSSLSAFQNQESAIGIFRPNLCVSLACHAERLVCGVEGASDWILSCRECAFQGPSAVSVHVLGFSMTAAAFTWRLPASFHRESAIALQPQVLGSDLLESVEVTAVGAHGREPLRPMVALDDIEGADSTVRMLSTFLMEPISFRVRAPYVTQAFASLHVSQSRISLKDIRTFGGTELETVQGVVELSYAEEARAQCPATIPPSALVRFRLSGCPAGMGLQASSGECTKCPPGSASFEGQRHCEPCAQGRFQPHSGMHECQECPWGLVSSQVGQTSCQACPKGTTARKGQSRCVICHFDYFDCSGGRELPTLKPGFWSRQWQSDVLSWREAQVAGSLDHVRAIDQRIEHLVVGSNVSDIAECTQAGLCAGLEMNSSSSSECRRGHDGPICMSCQDGWFPVAPGTCVSCPTSPHELSSGDQAVIALVLVLLMLFALYVAVFATNEAEQKKEDGRVSRRALLRLALNHLQLLVILQSLWGGDSLTLAEWFQALAPVGGDATVVRSFVCWFAGGNILSVWAAQLTLPFALCAIVLPLQFATAATYSCCNQESKRAQLTSRPNIARQHVLMSSTGHGSSRFEGIRGVLTRRKGNSSPLHVVEGRSQAVLAEISTIESVKSSLNQRVRVKSVGDIWQKQQFLQAWLIFAVAFYSTQAQVSARVLGCSLVGQEELHRLNFDSEIVCGQGEHGMLLVAALGLGIFPCLALPAALLWVGLRQHPKQSTRWAFLSGGYKSRFEWFEAVIFLRKLVLAILSTVSQTSIRFSLVLLVTMASLFIQVVSAPFESRVLNAVETSSLGVFSVMLSLSVPFVAASKEALFDYDLVLSVTFCILEGFFLLLLGAVAVKSTLVHSMLLRVRERVSRNSQGPSRRFAIVGRFTALAKPRKSNPTLLVRTTGPRHVD